MLLLGGFSIAAALSKHYIAKAMATWVLLRVGQKPANVLLASMFVAMFASMWISNVAAPALCFSLLQPILRTLETGNLVSRALVMGAPTSAAQQHTEADRIVEVSSAGRLTRIRPGIDSAVVLSLPFAGWTQHVFICRCWFSAPIQGCSASLRWSGQSLTRA